jgi:flavin reductase (DIM6/NTAB) family NADH-FMN oxidoreductase RutF
MSEAMESATCRVRQRTIPSARVTPSAPVDCASPADLRRAMGRFATGVTVVTSVAVTGEPVGTTANAVTSVSLDPPLVLVCFARASLTLAAVQNHGAFAVNVLGERHSDVSAAFARRGAPDAWDEIDHQAGHTNAPRLREALVSLECTVERLFPGGDHVIVLGRVFDIAVGDDDHAPLLFYRGGYASLHAG